jgi:hypothetical protein
MNYLYGDSTPSPLKSNFLEFLRDALDFMVFAVQADERVKQTREHISTLRTEADEEMARLDAFVALVTRTIEEAPKGGPNSPTAKLASDLVTASANTLQATSRMVREKLTADIARADAQEAAEREACFKALGVLLVPHDPPDATVTSTLKLAPSGAYEVEIEGSAGFGASWRFDGAVADSPLWSTPLHVERLVPQLEIRAPQVAGWLSKKVELRALRLEKHVVVEVANDGEKTSWKLRAEPLFDSGFDVEVVGRKITEVSRVAGRDDASVGPFELHDEDAPKLVELTEKLRASLGELKRNHLLEATFDDEDFRALPTFTVFVERLVAMMGPIVREIADRSLLPTELVIRRLLANDRREEIFVTRSALYTKYMPLPEAQREHFKPLGLENPSGRRYSETPAAAPRPTRSELPPSIPPEPISLPPEAVPPPLPISKVPHPEALPDAHPQSGEIAAFQPRPDGHESARTEGKNEALVAALKKIVGLAKKGNADDAYREYGELFSSAAFSDYRPEDQRQALRLMVLSKAASQTTERVVEAHRAAAARLRALVELFKDPADYEMLGVSQTILSDADAAKATFREGLELERERNPQSELCGNLMRRLSSL